MKKYLLLFFIYHSPLFAFSQGSWSQKASLPDTNRSDGMGFAIDSMGYMGLGCNLDSNICCYNDFWQYNSINNTWAQKATFPGKARIDPATFVIGHKAFVVTGATDYSYSVNVKECWEYDATTNKWTQKAEFPGISRAYAIGFAIGGKGYLGTGYDSVGNVYNDFWEYDTVTNSWTQKNNFPGASRYAANGFAVGDKGYLCFGFNPSSLTLFSDIWQYDTGTNSWTQKTNYPALMDYAAGFVIGTNIYIGIGQPQIFAPDTNVFWKYNTLTDTWTQEANFPGQMRGGASAFAINNSGYLGLGNDADTAFFNDMYEYIPDSLTDIDEVSNPLNTVSVFPNPVSTNLILKFSELQKMPVILSITGITGNEIISCQSSVISYQLSVDVSSLSAGMYFINIKNSKTNVTKKFIKS